MTTTASFNFSGTRTTPGFVPVPARAGFTYCQLLRATIHATTPLTSPSSSFARVEITYANPAQTVLSVIPAVLAAQRAPPLLPAPIDGQRYLASETSWSPYPLAPAPPPVVTPGTWWAMDHIYEWNAAKNMWLHTVPEPQQSTFVAGGSIWAGQVIVYGETSPPTWIPRVATMTYMNACSFNGTSNAEISLTMDPKTVAPTGIPAIQYDVRIFAPTDFTASIMVQYS